MKLEFSQAAGLLIIAGGVIAAATVPGAVLPGSAIAFVGSMLLGPTKQ